MAKTFTVEILEDGVVAEVLPQKFKGDTEKDALKSAQKWVDENRALATDAHEYKLQVQGSETEES